jgi:hypothetical protein
LLGPKNEQAKARLTKKMNLELKKRKTAPQSHHSRGSEVEDAARGIVDRANFFRTFIDELQLERRW